VAVKTQDQAFYALLFLYNEILHQPLDHVANVVRSRKPITLPEVFSETEIVDVMRQVNGKAWLQAMLMYGGGIRVGHLMRLRVKDVKIDSLQIYVRRPKGRNDYLTLMAKSVVESLEEHLTQLPQRTPRAQRSIREDRCDADCCRRFAAQGGNLSQTAG
jgi:integrase